MGDRIPWRCALVSTRLLTISTDESCAGGQSEHTDTHAEGQPS